MTYTREQIEETMVGGLEIYADPEVRCMLRQLLAENDALRADMERIDWMSRAPCGAVRLDFSAFAPTYVYFSATSLDVRQAIDAARKKTGAPQ